LNWGVVALHLSSPEFIRLALVIWQKQECDESGSIPGWP
jgi:hypothetical protein